MLSTQLQWLVQPPRPAGIGTLTFFGTEWTEKNLMKLNEKKTKQIIFNFNKDKQFTTEVRLKGEPLEIVDEVTKKLFGQILTLTLL